MAHAEELCQHVVMIHRGRKVLDEPMAGLRRQYDPRVIHVEPLDESNPLQSLGQIPGVVEVRPMADGCAVQLQAGTDPAAVMQRITATLPVARVGLSRLRLEDVFLRVVAAETGGADAERALRADLQGLGTEGALA